MPARTVAIALVGSALVACDAGGPACSGPFVTLRNPATLACGPRQLASPDCPDIPSSPWPVCKHPCEAIRDEAACILEPGCRITRELCDIFDDRCQREGPFLGCFPVDTDPAPAPAGRCRDLASAAACATRDDCGGQYLHGPDCPQTPTVDAGAAAALPPDGTDCTFSFVTCFDELAPPPT